MAEIHINGNTIQVGPDAPIVIEKLYGPSIFASLRITADTETNEWIIEREWIKTGEYIPWLRIPGGIAGEFSEEEKEG